MDQRTGRAKINILVSTLGLALFAAAEPAHSDPLSNSCEAFARLEAGSTIDPTASRNFAANARRLSEHLERAEALGFSGGAIVAQDGRTLLRQAYGYADKDNGRRMRADSVFDIGSVTKQFTAAAILRLEETGKLKVVDKITRFFSNVPAEKQGITIHQLLTHTAGFAHDVARREELLSRSEGVSRILDAPLRSLPGQEYHYSNAGFTLLAAIVEIASGGGYEQFLRDELWIPAGIKRTGNLFPAWQQSQFALGYNAAGSARMPPTQWWVADGPSWSVRGAGYVLSTADDLMRWAEALRLGTVLTEASRRKLFYSHVRETTKLPSYYGYGWAISAAPDGTCVIAHDGGAGFHSVVLRMYPAHRTTTVFFTAESRSPVLKMLNGASPLLFASPKGVLPQAQIELKRPVLRTFVGSYISQHGLPVPVVLTGDYLAIRSRESGILRALTAFPKLSADDQSTALSVESMVPNLFDTLRRGDYSVLGAVLPQDVTVEGEREFWPPQWRRWERDMGIFRRAEIIGHRRVGKELISYVQLYFEKSSLPVELLHRPNGKIFVNTVTMLFPERTALLPIGGDSFLAYNPTLETGVILRLDNTRDAVAFVATCSGATRCHEQGKSMGGAFNKARRKANSQRPLKFLFKRPPTLPAT